MPRKGLTMEEIINAATSLVEEKGYDNFSLRELASRLDVKPASLYNHTSNVAQITNAVGHFALDTLCEELKKSQKGANGKEKLLNVANAYRKYALNNRELYKVIVNMPSYNDDSLLKEGRSILKELYLTLDEYNLTHEEKIHFARAYRSAMHGFVSLEMNGYFQNEPNTDESYRFMIVALINSLLKEN